VGFPCIGFSIADPVGQVSRKAVSRSRRTKWTSFRVARDSGANRSQTEYTEVGADRHGSNRQVAAGNSGEGEAEESIGLTRYILGSPAFKKD
jgi:hypothetical protein